MKRGKSLPLARVSERKFRFECRRGAKRERERGVCGEKNRGKRIDILAPIPRVEKSSKRETLLKVCFSPLSLSLVRERQGQSPKD